MARGRPLDIPAELLEAFEHSGAVNVYLVSVLPDEVWRLDPGDDIMRLWGWKKLPGA